MNVIYIASVFDEECISRYFGGKSVLPYAASKYHTLLLEGLAGNGAKTRVLSVVPINRALYRGTLFRGYSTRKENIRIRYLSQVNLPVIKNVFNILGGFFRTLFSPKNSVLIYDALVVSASLGALAAAKLRGFRKVGIVTDLPKFQPVAKSSAKLKTNNRVLAAADGFVFLTGQMNGEVNVQKKPYLVLEGHVSAGMTRREHQPFAPDRRRVIYAGSLMKIYGIETLCRAFLKYAGPEEELHIYGIGDYEKELLLLAAEHRNIIYHGNRPNEEIVAAELDATLLVNPRPTDGEYTRFSFPSKTLEYMVSGTPVLSSRLEGIPAEYWNYIFCFEENTEDSLGKALRKILDLPPQALKEKGIAAREFALREKNNMVQSAKILEFCRELQTGERNGRNRNVE